MRKILLRSALALACASLLIAAASFAANRVQVRVIEQGSPVAGAHVDLLVSDGVISGVTDANGTFAADLSGNFFRVRVNSVTEASGHSVAESPVTVSIP